ncbi:deoxyribodipyrimidine photo-lyase [Quadrisphaera setariae]|uniref:deoxyribodipyrimidine photo-lyase n=1 Tax=Quadrisphaera setariae TaxID=2593304 RepID=UPI00164F5DCB|nr:deoxyribodipyrimidine photo-lyase [Quadrisphaera setariae]
MPRVVWLREDLHLSGNAAVGAAVAGAVADGDGRVVVLVPVEDERWASLPPQERARRLAVLRDLDDKVDGQLLFQHGDPAVVVPPVVRAAGATHVHVLGTGRPDDVATEEAVRSALDVPLVVHSDDDERGDRRDDALAALGRATFWMPVACHGYPAAP